MMKPRHLVNIGLVVIAVVVIGAAVIAATSGGKTAKTGDALACTAFWNWYDATSQVSSATGSTTPLLTAYKEATTQPLIDDLYNISVGLRDQGKGLNGNKAANAAYANNVANNVDTDCTNAGYADPAS